MSTKTMTVTFQSEIKKDEPQFFEANITVDYSMDKNYGADADGKGGIEKLFINEIEVHSCIDGQATLVELPLSDTMMDHLWEYVWENLKV